MANINGGEILTKQLKIEGVDVIFNMPGDPMTEINTSARQEGVRLINFRHEQACSWRPKPTATLPADRAWPWSPPAPL